MFSCVMILCFSVLYYKVCYIFYFGYRREIFLVKEAPKKLIKNKGRIAGIISRKRKIKEQQANTKSR